MKRNTVYTGLVVIACFLANAGWLMPSLAEAAERIRYSGSNQVYAAFDRDVIEAFTEATGIEVEIKTSSSAAAVHRLMNGYSDIASSARELSPRHVEYGYAQIAFCRDPLAVISKKDCGVDDLTEEQIRQIFGGDIDNWSRLGGPDLPVLVVIPERDTAANKNFRRQIMRERELNADFVAHNSTMAIEVVTHFPCGAISFIAQGATALAENIQVLKVDGRLPGQADYPYYQLFYYVTKGEPSGPVKAFVDFVFSENGRRIMIRNGMFPLPR